jgi:ATP-binding cassette subfamily B protein
MNRTSLSQWWHDCRRHIRHLPAALRLVWAAARGWTLAWAGLLLLQGAIPAASVYLTKVVVDAVAAAIGGGLSWDVAATVGGPAALLGGLLVLREAAGGVKSWVQTAQSELLRDHVKHLLHTQAARLDLAYFEDASYHDLMSRANEEADGRTLSLLQNLGLLAQHSITLGGVALILLPYGLWVPLALFAATGPALWVALRHKQRHHDWWDGTTDQRRWAAYYSHMLTHPLAVPEIRLLQLGTPFQAEYDRIRTALRDGNLQLKREQSLAHLGAGTWSLLVTTGVMGWLGVRALRGSATLGDLALFYRAFSESSSLLSTLLSSLGSLYADLLFLEHLFGYLALEPTLTEPENPVSVPTRFVSGLRFEQVGFRYPGSEDWVLRQFDLAIPAGTTVAVVGPNGAGKSTLAKLLCRIYDPQEGRVTLDGTDLCAFESSALRRQMTVMFQHPMRYVATAGDNIRFGNIHREAPRASVEAAAEIGGAAALIQRLPQGYDTLLGKQFQGGTELSGGQWQRLTLARALFQQAPFVILDEPTSYMDTWAEMQWLDRFYTHVQDRTALVVTHRFTTAMRADVIYVMDEGTVIESGSHDELLQQDGMYAASWRDQTTPGAHATGPAPQPNGQTAQASDGSSGLDSQATSIPCP